MGLLKKTKYPLRDTNQPDGLLDMSVQYQSEPMRDLLGYQDYGMRHDNSARKGLGYFGLLQIAQQPPYPQQMATEYSIGVPIAGKEREIPSLVPSLVQQEIDWILNGGDLTEEMQQKAYEHALKRIGSGKSPFAD